MPEQLVALGSVITVEQDPVEPQLGQCVIRLGSTEDRVDPGTELAVWSVLSRTPSTLEQLTETLSSAGAQGAQVDLDSVAQVVDGLRDRALVIGLDPGSPHLTSLALRVRGVALHRAMTAVNPGSAVMVGTASTAAARLTGQQHVIWSQMHDARCIAHHAVGRSIAEGTDPAQADIRDMVQRYLELVAAGAAYLDVAIS